MKDVANKLATDVDQVGRPDNSGQISVFPGRDGEDQNDSRGVLIRTSHTVEIPRRIGDDCEQASDRAENLVIQKSRDPGIIQEWDLCLHIDLSTVRNDEAKSRR